MVQIYA